MCKVEVKLILLSVHYIVIEITAVAFFTYLIYILRTNDVSEYFNCESIGESDCHQYLSDVTNSAILLRFSYIIWLLSPIMTILLKTNVFKHIKNCFLRTCSKE